MRPVGGRTKLGWGGSCDADRDEHPTREFDRVVHHPGDLTAVLGAGVELATAQAVFAPHGQMLALDPPDSGGATIGGVFATGDSGPLRHRYGAPRDLVLGMEVELSDGAVARSGGTVIKNVAGYDLAKLFCGSYGTLGLIREVAVRLHPKPAPTVTVRRPLEELAALIAAPLEAECIDVGWEGGAGGVLVRFGGPAARAQAERTGEPITDDEEIWNAQRAAQRSADRSVLKVSARPSDLARLIEAADAFGGRLVARAALGLAWLTVDDADAARAALAPLRCVRLDGSGSPWPDVDPAALAVMARVKERFDPQRRFRPGAFVGGI